MDRLHLEKIFFFGLGLALVLYPLAYWGYYSGDAIIHLVFGQNAAQGHLFEFNLGEKSSGESSVGYMLLVALFFKTFPATWVPIAVKIINYLTWILFLFVFYRLLEYKKFNKYIIAAALFAIGFLPGSVYNSTNGMENGLFGLFTLLWFSFSIKYSYFTLDAPFSRKTIFLEVIFSFILGVTTWLRPEALPFFVVAFSARFLAFIYYKHPILPISLKTFIGVIAFLLPIILLLLFIHWQTGMWIQSSVIARTLLGRIESYHFGSLIVDPKILIRLIEYFPITFFWGFGIIHFFKFDWREKIDEFFAISLFITFIFSFTLVSGAAQLGRYMIFLTPFWILIAARGVECVNLFYSFLPRTYAISLSVGVLALVGIYGIETIERFKLGNDRDLLMTINSPQNMQKESDALYAEMGRPKLPIIIAGGEVDDRYRLDNRFIVRCLDGRIDSVILKHFHKDSIDYVGYLKERGINYIVMDYSVPSFRNTLPENKLRKLKLGEHIDTEGLRLTYIGTSYSIFKVDTIGRI